MTIYKHSKRDIYLITYNPETQELFRLSWHARTCGRTSSALNTGQISDKELFIKSNLRLLCNQLMYRKRHGGSIIVLSQKGAGEGLLFAVAVLFLGAFVLFKFISTSNRIFKVYDTVSCAIYRTELSWKQLNRWFGRKDSDAIPFLMRPENRDQLITWFLARIFLCRGCNLLAHRPRHPKGHDVLMLEFEKENIRNEKMAVRIQNMWRARKEKFAKALSKVMQKHWDPSAGQFTT